VEASDLIDKIEKYLREFITYLLAFFDRRARIQPASDINQTVMFGIISAGVGGYLWNRYIYHDTGSVADTAGLIVDKLLEWCIAGVFIFISLRLARFRTEIICAIMAAIRTMAAAQIVAVGAVYVILQFAPFLLEISLQLDLTDWVVAGLSYLIYLGLVLRYLPGEIARIKVEDTAPAKQDGAVHARSVSRRRLAVTTCSLLFIGTMFVMSHFAMPVACVPGLAFKGKNPKDQNEIDAIQKSKVCERFLLTHSEWKQKKG